MVGGWMEIEAGSKDCSVQSRKGAVVYVVMQIGSYPFCDTSVKTYKLLRPCITELDPFLKKPENKFLLLLLSNYGHRF